MIPLKPDLTPGQCETVFAVVGLALSAMILGLFYASLP